METRMAIARLRTVILVENLLICLSSVCVHTANSYSKRGYGLYRLLLGLNAVQFVFHEVLSCAWQNLHNEQRLFLYTSLTDWSL